MLSMTGEVPLRVKNPRPDTTVEGLKMSAAELVVGKSTTPCIIRKVVYGNVENLNTESAGNVSILVFNRTRRTAHTRKGFVDVQITTKPVQFSVYIHADHLEQFFGACAIATVRAGLHL